MTQSPEQVKIFRFLRMILQNVKFTNSAYYNLHNTILHNSLKYAQQRQHKCHSSPSGPWPQQGTVNHWYSAYVIPEAGSPLVCGTNPTLCFITFELKTITDNCLQKAVLNIIVIKRKVLILGLIWVQRHARNCVIYILSFQGQAVYQLFQSVLQVQ